MSMLSLRNINHNQQKIEKTIIQLVLVVSLVFLVLPSLVSALRITCVNVLVNQALYDPNLSQRIREKHVSLATNCMPSSDVFSDPLAFVTQEEALLFADLQRKQGILSTHIWQHALMLPTLEKWPSFRLPSNMILRDKEIFIPFDMRWQVYDTRQHVEGEWRGTSNIATSLTVTDDILRASADNGEGYELFVLRWNGFTDSGPYRFLNFNVRVLPDTNVGVVVHYQGESQQIPLDVKPDEWTNVLIPFPLPNTQVQFVDFYASDKNLTAEDEFGLMLRNGKFSH